MTGITYGQLDSVMRSFGFQVRDVDADTRVYAYPGTRAELPLPIFPAEQDAYPHHLAAARMTVDLHGIGKADDFMRRILAAKAG